MHDLIQGLVGLNLLALWALAYFLPAVIVVLRKHQAPGPTIVVNGLLGWTGIGWIVALCMALGRTGRETATA